MSLKLVLKVIFNINILVLECTYARIITPPVSQQQNLIDQGLHEYFRNGILIQKRLINPQPTGQNNNVNNKDIQRLNRQLTGPNNNVNNKDIQRLRGDTNRNKVPNEQKNGGLIKEKTFQAQSPPLNSDPQILSGGQNNLLLIRNTNPKGIDQYQIYNGNLPRNRITSSNINQPQNGQMIVTRQIPMAFAPVISTSNLMRNNWQLGTGYNMRGLHDAIIDDALMRNSIYDFGTDIMENMPDVYRDIHFSDISDFSL